VMGELSEQRQVKLSGGFMSWISQRRPSLKRLWPLQEGLYTSTKYESYYTKEMHHDLRNAPEGAQ